MAIEITFTVLLAAVALMLVPYVLLVSAYGIVITVIAGIPTVLAGVALCWLGVAPIIAYSAALLFAGVPVLAYSDILD